MRAATACDGVVCVAAAVMAPAAAPAAAPVAAPVAALEVAHEAPRASAFMAAQARPWLALLWVALALPAVAADRVPRPQVEVDRSTSCVLPAALMRREHPSLLKHRRDRTVQQGVRGGSEALTACIDCHAGKTGSVVGSADAFCQSCHDYAAVKLDCFECHQSRRAAAYAGGFGAKIGRSSSR